MTIINSSLNFVNFLGVRPPFYIYGKSKAKTKLTLILSILFISFTIFLLIFFGRNLFTRDNAVINSFNDFSNDNDINLNTNNFFFAFTFRDGNGYPITGLNLNYINYHLSFYNEEILSIDEYNQKNNTNVSLVKCSEDFIKNFTDTDERIKEEILLHGYCLNLNNNSLKGSPLYGNYKTITFRMYIDEELKNKSIKENDSYVFSFPLIFRFYIQNYIYKKDNYNNPFQKKIGYQESQLEYLEEKKVYMFTFKTGISERDDHFLFTRINATKYNGFSSSYEVYDYYYNFFYKSCDDEYYSHYSDDVDFINKHCSKMYELLKINFYFEPYVEIYRRTYPKLQDVFVEIMSFVQLGLTIVKLTIRFFGRYEVLNRIIDNDYNNLLNSSNIKKRVFN